MCSRLKTTVVPNEARIGACIAEPGSSPPHRSCALSMEFRSHTDSYPVRKLLLTDARRASIVSSMANHSPHLDNVFSALADPTRRAIIARLSQGEASVGELAQPFDMALPSLMKHIRVLEAGGLVSSEKHGRVRTCRLMPGTIKGAENWLAEQRAIWEARLDRLESYVATLEKKPARGSASQLRRPITRQPQKHRKSP